MYKSDRTVIVAGVIITIIAFASAFAFAGSVIDEIIPDTSNPEIFLADDARIESDLAEENSESVFPHQITNPVHINLTLTWMDEGDATNRHTNTPDQFGLRLDGPGGQGDEISLVSNTHGQPGEVTLDYVVKRDPKDWEAGTGTWNITVVCGNCGDHTPMLSIIGFRDRPDNGNDWELAINIMYYEFEEAGGEA